MQFNLKVCISAHYQCFTQFSASFQMDTEWTIKHFDPFPCKKGKVRIWCVTLENMGQTWDKIQSANRANFALGTIFFFFRPTSVLSLPHLMDQSNRLNKLINQLRVYVCVGHTCLFAINSYVCLFCT